MIEIRILAQSDIALLESAGPDVFDNPVRRAWAEEFLRDSRHHLAVALENGSIVGFASAVHYLHPDKPPELWINEVGVAESHRRRGLASRILGRLLEHGRGLGCGGAWVLTEEDNIPAQRLYASLPGASKQAGVLLFAFPLEELDGSTMDAVRGSRR